MHLIIIGLSYHIYTHISATRCKRSLVTHQNVLSPQWGYLNWVSSQKLGICFKFTDVELLRQFFRRYSLFQVKDPPQSPTTMPHCDSPHWSWTNYTITPTTSTCKTLVGMPSKPIPTCQTHSTYPDSSLTHQVWAPDWYRLQHRGESGSPASNNDFKTFFQWHFQKISKPDFFRNEVRYQNTA